LVHILQQFVTKIAKCLYPHNPELLITKMFEARPANELGRLQDRYNKLIEFISQANANSKKKSNVRRITRAILTNSLTHKELASMKFSGKFGHICALHSGTNFKAAFNDAKLMVTGKDVVKVVHRRAKFTPEQANDLVKFILGGSAVNMLSWGYRKMKLAVNEVVELPALVRLADIQMLYQSYKQCINPLGRSTFFKVMKSATKGSNKIVTAIDYCSGILLSEPMGVVQDIIQYFYPNSRDE